MSLILILLQAYTKLVQGISQVRELMADSYVRSYDVSCKGCGGYGVAQELVSPCIYLPHHQ